MLNKLGFDLWANEYDQTVKVSEENDRYPFAGYKEILNTIYNEIMQKKQSNILDIGFGTAVLTTKLYDNNHSIDGLDFSPKMIKIAQTKMPQANLMEWDISMGLPDFLKGHKYDSIVSTYTIHHLSDREKVTFIKNLLPLLKGDGKVLIGDIAFQTRKQLKSCRNKSIQDWDEDEFYFVNEEISPLLKEFCQCDFYPISHCGGVFIISK